MDVWLADIYVASGWAATLSSVTLGVALSASALLSDDIRWDDYLLSSFSMSGFFIYCASYITCRFAPCAAGLPLLSAFELLSEWAGLYMLTEG